MYPSWSYQASRRMGPVTPPFPDLIRLRGCGAEINEVLVAFVSRFEREDGQALAEYGLLLALIAVACLAALTALGLAIAGTLGSITGAL